MKNRAKTAELLLLMILTVMFMTACGKEETKKTEDTLRIVCTMFPQYDWVTQIVGDVDGIEVTLLADDGTDMHSYQPTAADIALIQSCDMLVYNGGESEAWIAPLLSGESGQKVMQVSLIDLLGEAAKEEEMTDGMQQTEEQHEHDEMPEYDEHVWLSLKHAQVFVTELMNRLWTLMPEGKTEFLKNGSAYIAQLAELDEQYHLMVKQAKRHTVVVGDRFAYRYLFDDYDIKYYAAFPGCSAETEASFETVIYLADKVDAQKLPAVLVQENTDQKLAQTIISNTKKQNRKILVLHSLQSVSRAQIQEGISYLSEMEENLEVLKQALN
ncbi:MAG: metal ABC transporter substrate-binding protein [Lachnospiraceae bacterium]